LIYYLRVFDRESDDLVGHLVDLTTGGMMVISEEPLPVDREFHLRMDLPPGLFVLERWETNARSIWCRPDVNPVFHDTGLEFVGFTRQDELIVQDLIDNYGLND